MTLSQRHKAFARHYAQSANATEAYVFAFGTVNRRTAANAASILLKKEAIRKEIERIQHEVDRRTPHAMLAENDWAALDLWLLAQVLDLLERRDLSIADLCRIATTCKRLLAKMAKGPGEADRLSPEQLEGLP